MADVKRFPQSVVEKIDSADTVCSECFSLYDKDGYENKFIEKILHWSSGEVTL